MDCVLIGVSDRSSLWRHGNISETDYASFVKDYAAALAENFDNVIVTPDDGVYTDIAQAFGKLKRTKPIAYYPDKDTYYGIDHIKGNFDKYDIRPIGGDWYTLNAELTKQAPIVVCVGFSPGVLIELSFIKYHQKYGGYKDPSLRNIRCFIDERSIAQRLPASFEEQITGLAYFKNLEELVTLIKQHPDFT